MTDKNTDKGAEDYDRMSKRRIYNAKEEALIRQGRAEEAKVLWHARGGESRKSK